MWLPGVTASLEGAALSGSWMRAWLRAAGLSPATEMCVGGGERRVCARARPWRGCVFSASALP